MLLNFRVLGMVHAKGRVWARPMITHIFNPALPTTIPAAFREYIFHASKETGIRFPYCMRFSRFSSHEAADSRSDVLRHRPPKKRLG
jgi:hypothetical protein